MLKEVIGIAKQAGEAMLEFYTDDMEVMSKEDDSPLTKADLTAHRIIVKELEKLDPPTPIISEESGVTEYEKRREWTRFWLVDPLDGTKEFIKKNGEFTVNIALIEEGVPVLGVVYLPDKDVTYYAEKGKGSFKQTGTEPPVRIFSKASSPDDSLVAVQSRSHGSDKLLEELEEKGLNVVKTIPAGSSLKFCLVAEGEADIYPRMGPTMEWDVAAGDCVYRYSARGGVHESPLTYNKPDLKNRGFLLGLHEEIEL